MISYVNVISRGLLKCALTFSSCSWSSFFTDSGETDIKVIRPHSLWKFFNYLFIASFSIRQEYWYVIDSYAFFRVNSNSLWIKYTFKIMISDTFINKRTSGSVRSSSGFLFNQLIYVCLKEVKGKRTPDIFKDRGLQHFNLRVKQKNDSILVS